MFTKLFCHNVVKNTVRKQELVIFKFFNNSHKLNYYFKLKILSFFKTNDKMQKPTALAKILGVYKVGYRNPVTNTAQKQDLLVMENLFYKRKMGQVFDLKGSIRNRHVKTSGQVVQPDLVLLDENLLKREFDFDIIYQIWNNSIIPYTLP